MKRFNPLLALKVIIWGVFLLFIIIVGCTKQSSTHIKADIGDLIKNEFYKRDYGNSLQIRLNDSLSLNMQPAWEKLSAKPDNNGQIFYFIPLVPKLLSKDKRELAQQKVSLAGWEEYLIVKTAADSSFLYYKGQYLWDTLPASIADYSTFTGNLILNDFNHNTAIFTYPAAGQNRNGHLGKIAAASANQCVTVCTWVGIDMLGGGMVVAITRGSAAMAGNCPLPDPYIGGRDWRISESRQDCSSTNPGDPPPNPPGGGGGGGNTPPTVEEQLFMFDQKIEDSLTNNCLKTILGQVKNISTGKIGEIIYKFSGEIPKWNWELKEGTLPANTNGSTTLGTDGAVTTLDYNKLKKATNLAVARTIIHEAVHAYLTVYFRYDPLNAQKDYPGMLKAWSKSKHPDYNDIQHDQMVKSFVSDIGAALKEYGTHVLGLQIDDYIYNDLAWGGLDFSNNSQLSDADKVRIQNRLSAEQNNSTFDTESPAGQKACN